MAFWHETHPKARKPHRCIYCERTISPGEKYCHIWGEWNGDLQNYNLCERCEEFIHTYKEPGEFSTLYEELICGETFTCPQCGGYRLRYESFSDDMMKCFCECDDCGHKGEQDLSIEGIHKLMKGGANDEVDSI